MKTHGHSHTPTYNTWLRIISRCTKPSHHNYKYYGGRGITVCERWLKFENFYADMGERPKGKTVERVDNNKGYSPDNCRWATMKEQSNNRRSNKPITFNGETLTRSQWAERLGIHVSTMYLRCRRGLSIERILSAEHGLKNQPSNNPSGRG